MAEPVFCLKALVGASEEYRNIGFAVGSKNGTQKWQRQTQKRHMAAHIRFKLSKKTYLCQAR